MTVKDVTKNCIVADKTGYQVILDYDGNRKALIHMIEYIQDYVIKHNVLIEFVVRFEKSFGSKLIKKRLAKTFKKDTITIDGKEYDTFTKTFNGGLCCYDSKRNVESL